MKEVVLNCAELCLMLETKFKKVTRKSGTWKLTDETTLALVPGLEKQQLPPYTLLCTIIIFRIWNKSITAVVNVISIEG